MTQTELLMADIVAHSHDLAVLRLIASHQTSGHTYSKLIGAIRTLRAELDIKQDLLGRMCAPWFEASKYHAVRVEVTS